MKVDDLIKKLSLQPHFLGGLFSEIFRSTVKTTTEKGERCAGSAIYYLLTPQSPNGKFSQNQSEVMHVWCGGGAQVQTYIMTDGTVKEHILGPRVDLGQYPQVVLPARAWKTTRLLEQDKYSLESEVVLPGWEQCDFKVGRAEELVALFPQHKDLIEKNTLH